MHRRTFLNLTAGALSGFALDPERLLWRPGAKTFFLPARPSQVQINQATYSFWKGTVLGFDSVNGWTPMHGSTPAKTILGVWDGSQVVTQGATFARVGVS